jgi:glycosyltransferase involved in cell wall biosynthesis
MNNPLVSIIIPVYNAAKYLNATIQCVIDQTWSNKEIIIVDDGSTDNSLAIARLHENHRQVRVFSQTNKGSGATRNKGLREAKGAYIQFLDADDLLSANKIERQMELLLQNPGSTATCSTVHFFDGDDPYASSPSAYDDTFLYDSDNPAGFLANLYGGNNYVGSMIQTNAWLSPASVIKKAGWWSEFYSPDDDGEFFCRVVLASDGIVYAKDCLNFYRKYRSQNNLAAAKTKAALIGKFKSFLLKKDYLLAADNSPLSKKALANYSIKLAIESYPVDKDLSNETMNVITELGGTEYIPKMGGQLLELIKNTFGWKLARTLQYTYSKLNRR